MDIIQSSQNTNNSITKDRRMIGLTTKHTITIALVATVLHTKI
jgi:hypothetical protein